MSPLLIESHNKTLVFPDDSGDFEPCEFICDIKDKDNREYSLHREVVSEEQHKIYIQYKNGDSNITVANYILSFCLVTPSNLNQNLPQMESAYVNNEYRSSGISVSVYLKVIEIYGGVISDTYQTIGGMLLWLIGLSKIENLNIFVMNKNDNNVLSYFQLNDDIQTSRKRLAESSHRIWSKPQSCQISTEDLLFELSVGEHGSRIVLLAHR